MPILFYVAFALAAGIAVFAVQNSGATPVVIRFLFWEFETSLVYALLGSVCSGILVTLLFWLQRFIRVSRRMKQKALTGREDKPQKA